MKVWIPPAIATLIFWGLYASIPKLATAYIGPLSSTVYMTLRSVFAIVVILALLNSRLEVHPQSIIYVVIAGILMNAGNLCFLVALSKSPVSLAVAFTALYPVLVIILAVVILGESINARQAAGVALSLLAMFLIAG